MSGLAIAAGKRHGVGRPIRGERMSESRRSARIDPKLLELLACPLTKGPLVLDAERDELVSRLAHLAYPVRDGIPIMLTAEARRIEEDPGKSARPKRGTR
jgi:uncharacterized protein YbaR (Trm112 family)